jgi:hypothetical protein
MHQPTPQNPLSAAARETMAAARETKSPLMEKLAIGTMIGSAVVSTGLGVVQVVRMVNHDREKAEGKAYQRLKRELDAKERERRTDAASPPPERPGHGGTATAGMPDHGRGDDDRRWSRREEHAEAAGHGKHR